MAAADFDAVVFQVQATLDQILTAAEDLRSQASNAAHSAITQSKQYISSPAIPFDFAPKVVEPNVYIPTIAPNSDAAVIINESERVIASLKDNFTTFFNTYFPDECDYLAKAQSWICSVIDNGGIALSPEVEALIYGRDRDRIEGEYYKGLNEASALWAGRNFPLPPGALIAAQLGARTNADKLLGEASRGLAIRQAELRIDTVKFAVEQAINLRTAAIGAAVQYLQALIGAYDASFKVIQQQNDGQAKLISAASDYYRTRLGVEELRFKAEALEAELMDKANERFVSGNVPLRAKAAEVAATVATSLGSQAAAALNALHTGASLSASATQ